MIYIFIEFFLFLFASILLICFIYANFFVHSHYYFITVCSSRVSNIYRDKKIIRTQQQRQHQTVGIIYLFIAYFCIYFPPYDCFVLFMLNFFHFHYYCIKIFLSRVLEEVYITLQHRSINNIGGYVQYIYQQCILSFFLPLFFCLLYYLIIFPIIVFISNYYQ